MSAQDGCGSGSNDDSQDFSQWMSSSAQTFSNQSSMKISRPKLCSDLTPDEDQAAAAREFLMLCSYAVLRLRVSILQNHTHP
jgi:hypothetical protein